MRLQRSSSWLCTVGALVLGCRSQGVQKKPDSAKPRGATPSAMASAVAPKPDDSVSPLPYATSLPPPLGVMRPFAAPRVRVEGGTCWVRARRLDAGVLERTRLAFVERNPDWTDVKVNPFTGLVEGANHWRHDTEIGPTSELSAADFAERRLEPLLRNADLIGTTEAQLRTLEWSDGSFRGSTVNRGGSAPHAFLHLTNTAAGELPHARVGFRIMVTFQRDGVVVSFDARREGPIAELCTTPSVAAEHVRSLPEVLEASATDAARSSSEPLLGIDERTEPGPALSAATRTWSLVWFFQAGRERFVVDAMTGKLIRSEPTIRRHAER
jgi:hypothetical protein